MVDSSRWNFATRSLHVGQGPDKETGAIVLPIHLASTYAQDGVGKHKGFEYSRSNNPTRQALEECLASLENASHCSAFSSGLGAETAILTLLSPGDHLLYMEDVYGGTYRLLTSVFARYGITSTGVDATNLTAVRNAITPETKLIWLETPTNPLLHIVDIKAISDIAHEHNIMVCIDNTFATPYLQQPLALGADIVLHSTTKYLGGHSDIVGGAVLTSRQDIADHIAFHQNAMGIVPSPFDCWLLLRGIKTLAIRLEKQCENALALAHYLEAHPGVQRTHYPGLPSHPQHRLAQKQMRHPGGMISIDIGTIANALHLLENLHVITCAESLGAVESLAEHPALMTHSSVPQDIRYSLGITDGLVRISVGIEDIDDLRHDLDVALEGVAH